MTPIPPLREAVPQGEAPRRRRRLLLGSLAAVCLIVGAALAISFAAKGQGKDKHDPAAGLPPMGADKTGARPVVAKEPVLPTDATAIIVPPASNPTTATPALPTITTTPPVDGTKDLTFAGNVIQSGTIGGATIGSVAGAVPGASTLNDAFNALAARAASLSGLRTCTPVDGPDLQRMVASTSNCGVILLTKGSSVPYVTDKTMVVSSRKIILGHPIDLPQIKSATGVERVFDVLAGGSLDIRFVSIFRGAGRALAPDLRIIVGGIVLVRLGGYFRGTAIIFRDPDQTFTGIRNDLTFPLSRRRAFGGHVLVLGGSFFCYGCQVVRWYPYGLPVVNVAQVGRDFLVIAGVCVCVGVYHLFYAPYLSSINVGNAVAVLGGVIIRIGGGVEGGAVLVGQFGAGQNLFVGGGVLVNVGHQQQSVFLCLMRAGFGMAAVGAGVFIHIAELENRAWGVAAIVGAGQVYSNGAGILDKTGGEVVNTAISTFQALVGGSSYLGAGDMQIVGEQFARVALTQDQNGVGMTWFNGAGDTSLIYVPSMVIALVRAQKILGAEVFHGAGFFTGVNDTRWSFQLVNAQIPGYEGWVGLGAALFIRSRTTVERLINYRSNKKVSWVVNGVGVGGGAIAQNNLFVNKTGIFVLKPQPTKHRLLAAVDGLVSSVAGMAKSGAPGKGFTRPALIMAKSEMDSSKARPPDPEILASKLQSLVAALKQKRRLQGQAVVNPTRVLNMFHGLSPVTLMEAWKEAMEETNNKKTDATTNDGRALAVADDADTLDADGRWGEQVYVGGGAATQCVLCGVGPGPSASHWTTGAGNDSATCHVTEACTTTDSFQGIMAAVRGALPDGEALVLPPVAQGWAAAVGSKYTARVLQGIEEHQEANPGAEIKMPDTNVLTYDISLYCPVADADCSYSQADMKAAFKNYLDEAVHKDSAYKLSAANAAVHPAVLDIVNQADGSFLPATAAPALDGCGKGLQFSLHLTAPDKPSVQDLQQVLEDAGTDSSSLMAYINDQGTQEAPFCSVSLTTRSALFFPALDTAAGRSFYQNLYTGNALDAGAIWPDVTVVSAHEVAPIQHAVADQSYTVLLEGFAMKADVVLQLFQGTQSNGVTVATVPGGIGPGETRQVAWTAPGPIDGEAGNRAYLRAYHVGMPAIFAQSEVFDLLSLSALDD